MNGRFSSELSKAELLTAAGQILDFSPNDEAVVENIYLTWSCSAHQPFDRRERVFRRNARQNLRVGRKEARSIARCT